MGSSSENTLPAGSPQSSAPQGPEAAISAGSATSNSEKAETEKTEAKQDPGQTSPGLSHRQLNRPVGPQARETDKDNTQSQYVASLPAQDAARQPRASLQPLSALQQTPYASPKANAPVRHADFAQSQQVPKALAVVQFWLTFHAEFGQKLRVVGSHKNLGRHATICMHLHLMPLHFCQCVAQDLRSRPVHSASSTCLSAAVLAGA